MDPALGDRIHHTRVDPHRAPGPLTNVILGAQDGLVNTLGVVLGVAAATGDPRVVLAGGFAAACAQSISMAAVAYTTTQAERDLYRSERAREYRHIETVPDLERQEIRELYASKGFEGEILDRIVSTITANKDVWVAAMMAEEHHLVPVPAGQLARAARWVGLSSLVGALVPLVPFLVLPVRMASIAAAATATLMLFGLGAYKARATVGHPVRSGIQIAVIGLASALVGYLVGALLEVPPG